MREKREKRVRDEERGGVGAGEKRGKRGRGTIAKHTTNSTRMKESPASTDRIKAGASGAGALLSRAHVRDSPMGFPTAGPPFDFYIQFQIKMSLHFILPTRV